MHRSRSVFPFDVQPWQLDSGELCPDRILDIRGPESFSRGHIPGAENLPYERFQAEVVHILQPRETVLVVDPAGARAAEMAMWLCKRGHSAGYLDGGMSRWKGELERSR